MIIIIISAKFRHFFGSETATGSVFLATQKILKSYHTPFARNLKDTQLCLSKEDFFFFIDLTHLENKHSLMQGYQVFLYSPR